MDTSDVLKVLKLHIMSTRIFENVDEITSEGQAEASKIPLSPNSDRKWQNATWKDNNLSQLVFCQREFRFKDSTIENKEL